MLRKLTRATLGGEARHGQRFRDVKRHQGSLILAGRVASGFGEWPLCPPTVLGGLERMPDMSVILMGAGLAILAPLLTCWLEMAALRKIGTQNFGIMMSLEPAIATVLGLVILHESPSPQQIFGMACVILALAAAVVLLGRKPDLA